ncbi:MAG: hypothetical protein ABFD92_05530 [Planctomycetaceae bacterium]
MSRTARQPTFFGDGDCRQYLDLMQQWTQHQVAICSWEEYLRDDKDAQTLAQALHWGKNTGRWGRWDSSRSLRPPWAAPALQPRRPAFKSQEEEMKIAKT